MYISSITKKINPIYSAMTVLLLLFWNVTQLRIKNIMFSIFILTWDYLIPQSLISGKHGTSDAGNILQFWNIKMKDTKQLSIYHYDSSYCNAYQDALNFEDLR